MWSYKEKASMHADSKQKKGRVPNSSTYGVSLQKLLYMIIHTPTTTAIGLVFGNNQTGNVDCATVTLSLESLKCKMQI